MTLRTVVFVDTSVIVRLIGIDGKQPARVERDQFKRSVAHRRVEVWTFDNELSAYG